MYAVKLVTRYPIPTFVLFGLFIGIVAWFVFGEQPAHWIWFATLVIGGAPIVFQTLKGMAKGRFASDIVAMLAIITAVLLNEAFAGAVVVLMQSGGEAIEAYGLRRATSSLEALLARAPRIARRRRGDEMEDIAVDEVRIGDLLLVRGGDLIPVDGTMMEGIAEVDESALTGEPLNKNKQPGDQLLSGSVNVNGALVMRADRVSQESQYAKIVRLVKKAQEEKAPIQRLADRYAIFFTPLALLMALVGFLVTGEPTTALAVLVVATPCPLILATPLAIICGINRAADSGIIVKGGASLEQVASTKAALFDKTGTITFGKPALEKVVPLGEEKEEQILYYAAIIEQFSSHLVAKAILEKASQTFSSLPLPEQFHEIPGQGVEGIFQGSKYRIGSRQFLGNWDKKEVIHRYYEENKLLIFVVKDNKCLGILVLSDHIRPNAPQTIESLYQLGVERVIMVTGDSKKNAETVARQTGIKEVEGELLPEQKVEIVKKIKANFSPVLMIGDGINDAPALASATVGMAMGAYGTAISAEAADIVFLVDDLGKVVETIRIGKKMLYIAKQSIGVGIGLSFMLMGIAAFGYIPPPLGALLQEVIDVAVILNALRAR